MELSHEVHHQRCSCSPADHCGEAQGREDHPRQSYWPSPCAHEGTAG